VKEARGWFQQRSAAHISREGRFSILTNHILVEVRHGIFAFQVSSSTPSFGPRCLACAAIKSGPAFDIPTVMNFCSWME
jgi:hypothetical protein